MRKCRHWYLKQSEDTTGSANVFKTTSLSSGAWETFSKRNVFVWKPFGCQHARFILNRYTRRTWHPLLALSLGRSEDGLAWLHWLCPVFTFLHSGRCELPGDGRCFRRRRIVVKSLLERILVVLTENDNGNIFYLIGRCVGLLKFTISSTPFRHTWQKFRV